MPQVEVNLVPFADSYADLSKRWWNWVASIEDSESHPLKIQGHEREIVVERGTSSVERGTNDVFFLAGSLGGGSYNRIIHVPKDKRLFFPVANVIASEAEGDGPEDRMIQIATDTMNNVRSMSLEVDDKPVPENEIKPFYVKPTAFTLSIPHQNNILRDHGAGIGDWPAVTAGYCIMVEPLSPGEHNVHIKSSFDPVGEHDDPINVDVKYKVIIPR